jgi:tetratricopeptide (TPR) repeat protein
LEVFESITRIEPGTPGAPDLSDYSHAYRRIGDVYTRTGQLEEALQAFESALELDADSALARRGLGYAYSLTGRFDEALQEYDRALEIDPEMVMARFLVAQAQLSLGRFAEAVEAAEAALALDPEHWESGYTRGMALLRMGRAAEGRALLRDLGPPETSDEVSQEHGMVYSEVSAVLGEARYDEAVSLLEAGIDETPEFSLFHLNLGVIQSRVGDHEAALRTFSNIVDQGLSNHFLVHWNLAREYAALGNVEASERHRALHLQLLHLYLTSAVE